MPYSWPMEEDDMMRRMREHAEEVERRLKAEAKSEQRYKHRLWFISMTFVIVFVVVALPTQNESEWLPFIAASLAAAFVNLLLRESHRIDDN